MNNIAPLIVRLHEPARANCGVKRAPARTRAKKRTYTMLMSEAAAADAAANATLDAANEQSAAHTHIQRRPRDNSFRERARARRYSRSISVRALLTHSFGKAKCVKFKWPAGIMLLLLVCVSHFRVFQSGCRQMTRASLFARRPAEARPR